MTHRYGLAPYVPYNQYPVASHPPAIACPPAQKGTSGRGGVFEGPTVADVGNICGARTGAGPTVPMVAWPDVAQWGNHPTGASRSQMPVWPPRTPVPFSPSALTIGFGAAAPGGGLMGWVRGMLGKVFRPRPAQAQAVTWPQGVMGPNVVIPGMSPERVAQLISPNAARAGVHPMDVPDIDAEYIMNNRSRMIWTGPQVNAGGWTPRGGILDGSTLQGGIQDGQASDAAYYDAAKPETIGTGVSIATLPNPINNANDVPMVTNTPALQPQGNVPGDATRPVTIGKPMGGFGAAATRPEANPRAITRTGASEGARRPVMLGRSVFQGRVYENGIPRMNITPPLTPMNGSPDGLGNAFRGLGSLLGLG